MFYYCGIVSMRYLLTDYLGEHSNNHIIKKFREYFIPEGWEE